MRFLITWMFYYEIKDSFWKSYFIHMRLPHHLLKKKEKKKNDSYAGDKL